MGPVTSAELSTLGLDDAGKIRELGWQEVFLRWIEAYPGRLNVNAACGLIAVVEGVDWRNISPQEKRRAQSLVAALRRARG